MSNIFSAIVVLILILVVLSFFEVLGVVIVSLVAVIVGIGVIWVLCDSVKQRSIQRKFRRDAPSQIRRCMEGVEEYLEKGGGHLEIAKHELEAGTAPLFWDAMDDFALTIEHGRAAWNEAVDIAERYERVAAESPEVEPDASLPELIVDLGEKWMSLRRQSLGNEHFATIFEQRRQADKIADRLKQQGERIQVAIDAARRAQLAASQAVAIAEQADRNAQRAGAKAGAASAKASAASAKAGRAISEVKWSKI